MIGDTGADRFLQSGASDRYIENNIAHATVMYQTEDRDTIVGFAVCKHDLITLLMMATETHRQGFGSQLLKHCEQELLGNFPNIRLESFEGNNHSNRFYEKNRWSLLQCEADKDSGVNKYIYIKRAEG